MSFSFLGVELGLILIKAISNYKNKSAEKKYTEFKIKYIISFIYCFLFTVL